MAERSFFGKRGRLVAGHGMKEPSSIGSAHGMKGTTSIGSSRIDPLKKLFKDKGDHTFSGHLEKVEGAYDKGPSSDLSSDLKTMIQAKMRSDGEAELVDREKVLTMMYGDVASDMIKMLRAKKKAEAESDEHGEGEEESGSGSII